MTGLLRTSRRLRIAVRRRPDVSALEVLEAGSKTSGGLLAFVAPADALAPDLVRQAGRSAHRHLPMVRARALVQGSTQSQYVRVTQGNDGMLEVRISGIRINTAHRTNPLQVAPVRVRRMTPAVLEASIEVTCRRARLALAELDEAMDDSRLLRFEDELLAAEARLVLALRA